ncbi:MAG TPA: hypothetical protein VGP36_07485 [Mycobacteriales bacterium]|nr:hypothetical protein [Mycobacteriales bacterium]
MLLASGVVLLIYSWRLGALGDARQERRHATAVARRFGLPPDAVDDTLVRRIARRQRFVQTGVLVGLLFTPFLQAWFVPLYAGLALGAAVDQVAAPRLPADTPRVAHVTDLRLSAYVPAWLLVASALGAACAPVLLLVWAVAPRTPPVPVADPSTAGAVTLAALSLLGLGVSLGLARFVVGRPQAAGSSTELAVDDALRAQAVRDALHITAVVSLTTTMVLGLKEGEVGGALRYLGGALPVVLLAGIALAGITHELTAGPKHWRRLVAA